MKKGRFKTFPFLIKENLQKNPHRYPSSQLRENEQNSVGQNIFSQRRILGISLPLEFPLFACR